MVTCDMNRFQGFFQICANCCIPASIENVIRYHGGDFPQREFLDKFLKKYRMTDLHFTKVKEFLDCDVNFNKYFTCDHKTKEHHKNFDGLLAYFHECISKDLPVIVALNQKTQDGVNKHVVTVHYIEGDKISYFDSDPKSDGFNNFKQKHDFVKLLSENLGTLVIKRK